MAEVIDRRDTTSMRTVDMNEKEDMIMSDQPPSASKLLQQHTQSSTSMGEKVSSNIPFRGFDNGYKKISPQDMTQLHNTTQPGPVATFFKGLFSPRATDIQQLLIKLQTQVSILSHSYHMFISYVLILMHKNHMFIISYAHILCSYYIMFISYDHIFYSYIIPHLYPLS